MNQLKIVSLDGKLVADSRDVAEMKDPTISEQLKAIDRTIARSFRNPNDLEIHLRILDGLYFGLLKEYPFIRQAITQTVMSNYLTTRDTEFDKHKLFERNWRTVFDSSHELTSRKNNPAHIPDFWMRKDENFIPVEIKLNNFTTKSLKQLLRYMDFYDCERGIAVAEKLTCTLPENIKFISFKELGGSIK